MDIQSEFPQVHYAKMRKMEREMAYQIGIGQNLKSDTK